MDDNSRLKVRFSGVISVTWFSHAQKDSSHKNWDFHHSTGRKHEDSWNTNSPNMAVEQRDLHGRYYSGIALGANLAWGKLARNKATSLVTKSRPSSPGPAYWRLQASALFKSWIPECFVSSKIFTVKKLYLPNHFYHKVSPRAEHRTPELSDRFSAVWQNSYGKGSSVSEQCW